ncbi:MAG TPA: response regulator transcription factor [Dehalococcoidia bacterium]
MKILIAEADVKLAGVLAYALSKEGYHVISAPDGVHARRSWIAEKPDLVLLEATLTNPKAFDLCREMRTHSSTPIIMLGDRLDESDIVDGLESGADDYIVKPFTMRQLVLRARALLRRYAHDTAQALDEHRIVVADLTIDPIDPSRFSVCKHGTPIQLTRLESRLLYCLAANTEQVVANTELAHYGWKRDVTVGVDMLKTHISHIRHKLNAAGGAAVQIRAIPRTGYLLSTVLDRTASAGWSV